ncbi:MAG TPA: O-antigen ligase family protein [Burkholderiaceae bacterium]|nr:O-antigen ligase family protein [Burkholderiaceae bacterium]
MTFSLNALSLNQARMLILSALCFVLPMRASFIYLFSALLLLVWAAEGRRLERLTEVFHSKLCLAFLVYYSVFLLAMLWTEDKTAGWHMVDRYTPILLFLLFWSSAEPRYQERYLSAFLAGLSVCAILAHYNWLQLHWFPDWPHGVRVSTKSPDETAPFVDRIMYTPILAIGAYFSLRRAVLNKEIRKRAFAAVIAGLLISNLVFSDGRAGMVMFAVLFGAVVFERVKARGIALVLCAILLPLTFFTAYNTQHQFRARVDVAISDIKAFDQDPNTSLGLRMVYWSTSFHLFLQHPLYGVGSGDFQTEYARIKPERWKSTPDSFNPHNQYLLTAATTGLLGLAALINAFWVAARLSPDMRTKAVLLGFAVVCLFESYLWRSNTSLTFSAILAVLMAANKPRTNS